MSADSGTPQRYNGWELERDDKGPFVRVEDYELLQREAAALRADRDALAAELRNFINIDMANMRNDFGSDADEQFRLWVQSRSKRALSQHGGTNGQ